MSTLLYDEDFVRWAEEMAAAIREGRFDALDRENVAEEIESLGRSDKRAIVSHLESLIAHLLEWRQQSELRSRSWRATIFNQRHAIEKLVDESPSLRPQIEDFYQRAWTGGRSQAARETGYTDDMFPLYPVWTVEQALDEAFFPEWPGQ